MERVRYWRGSHFNSDGTESDSGVICLHEKCVTTYMDRHSSEYSQLMLFPWEECGADESLCESCGKE